MTMRVRRLDRNHDMTFGHGFNDIASGAESAAQRLVCRLLTIKGEWFLNTDDGVPWWQPTGSSVRPIMGAPRDLQYTEAVIKAHILETDGIATIEGFLLAFDSERRRLLVTATGTSVDGDVWNITQAQVGQ